jgi:hypothetical protein
MLMFGTDATCFSINVYTSTFVWRRIGIASFLAFELEYTLHYAGDCVLRSVHIAAQYGAVLNLELDAILDEFMLL